MNKRQVLQLLTLLVLTLTAFKSFAGDPLKNASHFKFALIIPKTDFGKFNNGLGQPDTNGIIPYQHISASTGFGVQFGKMFYFKPLNATETMNIGMDVTWFGLSYLKTKYHVSYSMIMDHITVFFEVGPMFNYYISESMTIDASFKLTPTIGFIGGGDTKNPAPVEGENWLIGTSFGLRYTPALYFRFNEYILGAEYSLGGLSFNYNIQNYGGRSYPSDYETGRSPYSTLRIVLGVQF